MARETNGPRGSEALPLEDRDNYENLILLCRDDHGLVDDRPLEYTVEKLTQIKYDHEGWVASQLSPDEREDLLHSEYYADMIDQFVDKCRLHDWRLWASSVLCNGQPSLDAAQHDSLESLRDWLFGKIWPGKKPALEAALRNFLSVLSDFLIVFNIHVDSPSTPGGKYITSKFYRSGSWNPNYDKQLREFEYLVDLIVDLMLELTRAANHVCSTVRSEIDPTFRLKDGCLLVDSGPNEQLRYEMIRCEYSPDEIRGKLYGGLNQFMIERSIRSINFGHGLGLGIQRLFFKFGFVIRDHQPSLSEQFVVEHKDHLEIQGPAQKRPGWLMVSTTDNHHGLIPASLVRLMGDGAHGISLDDFDAGELPVKEGDHLLVICKQAGFYYCELQDKGSGWVPCECITVR